MNIKRHLPNALTCCNLVCGCLGIIESFHNRLDIAFFLVIAAGIFDFFDGFVARILKVNSPIGKDLDSLADMVTFGVLPGFIMYRMFSYTYTVSDELEMTYTPFISFVMVIFSALRLAKFNNDTRQTDGFIGVATPANTLLVSSLGYILWTSFAQPEVLSNENSFYANDGLLLKLLHNSYALSAFTILMSFLLVAEIPMFALKFKNFGWAANKVRYLFLIIAVILLILFQLFAIPFIIFLYILISVINNIITKSKKINP